MDKGLEHELRALGLDAPDLPFVLPGEDARQMGARCHDCGSAAVVYLINAPMPGAFERGAYCYRHLLERCRRSGQCPYPIPTDLLDRLQADITPGKRTMFISPEKLIDLGG